MASAEVLQEYLVKLGYTIDKVSLGKFNNGMSDTSKSILKVGGAVAGVVAGIEASTAAFAYSMRKMYFQSQLTGASIKNLNALGFAEKQVGVEAGSMAAAMQTMQRQIRTNPGMTALLDSLTGRRQEGRPADKVLDDVMSKLRQMPEFVGAQWAQQIFGMDADTYHLLITQWDTLSKKKEDALDIYRRMGTDPDKAAAALLKYATTMDTLKEKFSALGATMMIEFAPEFDAVNSMVSDAIDWWADWAKGINKVGDLFKNFDIPSISKLLKDAYGQSPADTAAGKKKSFAEWLFSSPSDSSAKQTQKTPLPAPIAPGTTLPLTAPTNTLKTPLPSTGKGVAAPTAQTATLFRDLEFANKLPPGLLDSIWKTESGRGTNMTSPKGAQGHFQFMPKTQKEFGLQDPNDLGESANAAARKMSGLLKYYKGDREKAVAAYNFGEGNLDKHIAKSEQAGKNWKEGLNPETSSYIDKVLGGMNDTKLGGRSGAVTTVSVTNTFNITGDNAKSISKEVGAMQQNVSASLARNLGGGVM